MKRNYLFIVCAICSMQALGQNVGIGTGTPTQKLDVNGNVNVSGNLLIGGVAGQANQVLTTDNGGNTVWANLSQYKEHLTYVSVGNSSWIVPDGVTKIMLEGWGAGGGGSTAGGGGGGGYIAAYFTVTPGATVSFTIGAGGSGTTGVISSSNNGGSTTIVVNSITLTASGGTGSYQYSATGVWLGRKGTFSVSSSSFRNWLGISGEDGRPNQLNFIQPSGSIIWETTLGGSGGNAGNTTQTGAMGGYAIYNMTTSSMVKYVTPGRASQPGGGGSGNADKGVSYYGTAGEEGMVRIHY